MSAPWVKLWCDLLADATIQRWHPSLRWCWCGTLLLAVQSKEPGTLLDEEGRPLSVATLAALLTVDWKTAKTFVERATGAGKLTRREDGALQLRGWAKRQFSVNATQTTGDESARKTESDTFNTRASDGLKAEDRGQKRDSSLGSDSGCTGLPLPFSHTRIEPVFDPRSHDFFRGVASRLADADARTPAVLATFARRGLPEAAFRTAMESLESRRSSPDKPGLVSESRYFVSALKKMEEERQYAR